MQLPFMRSDPLGLPLCMRSVDYSLLPVGAMAGRTLPGGRTYTQAAGSNQTEETVRTGLSTVARWAFVANTPRIGLLADGGIGLVLEPPRTNDQPRSDANHAEWVVTSVTKAAVQGPDGIANSAVEVTDSGGATGFISRPTNYTGGARYVSSVWVLSVSGAGGWGAGHNDGNPDDGIPIARAGFVSWARRTPASYMALAGPVSSWSLIPAYTAAADVGVVRFWGNQREIGKYATNHIPTNGSNASRGGFRLELPVNTYVVGGAFRAQISHVPWTDCTAYDGDSATVRLWTIDANTYAEINTTTRVLTVCVNGVSRVAAVPVWWLSGHRIEWYWRVGNGALFVRYRLSTDKGVSYTLPFDPFAGVQYTDAAISTSATSLDLWSDGGSSKWFGTGACKEDFLYTAPAWALLWLPTDDATVKAWFRADGHYTLSAGLVSAWTSQTAAAVSAAQGTAANQPVFGATSLNGKPGVTFDRATTDIMTVTGLSAAAGNILAVASIKPNSNPNAAAAVFDTQTASRLIVEHSNALSVNGPCYYDGAFRDPGAAGTTLAQILAWDLRASPGGRVYRNGAQIGSTVGYTQRAIGGTVTIGGRYDGTGYGNFVQGDFVLSVAPSDALRRNIETFLSAKYGIAVA